MTAKNVGDGKPIPGDRYFTPDWAVHQCLTEVLPQAFTEFPGWLRGETPKILEPSAGRGVFVDHLRDLMPAANIHAVDIDQTMGPWENATTSWVGDDFLGNGGWGTSYDLVIGNPPFTLGLEFCIRALQLTDRLVYILRQGFLASAKRSKFFRQNKPSHVFQIPHRPSFTDDGQTDAADYCWIVWQRPWAPSTQLIWLPEVPKEDRQSHKLRVHHKVRQLGF